MSHVEFEATMNRIRKMSTQVYQAEVETYYNISKTAAQALRNAEDELTIARDCMGDDNA